MFHQAAHFGYPDAHRERVSATKGGESQWDGEPEGRLEKGICGRGDGEGQGVSLGLFLGGLISSWLKGRAEANNEAKLFARDSGRTQGYPHGVSVAFTAFGFLPNTIQEYGLPVSGDRPSLETRVQEWIILWNSNLDTSHPRSLPSLRAKLNEAEASRKRDKEKGKEALGQKLGTAEGMKQYVAEKKGEFERLRLEIMARDKKRREADSGTGKDSAIEVD